MTENATRGPLCRPYYGGKARKSPNGVTKFNKRPGHVIFRKESREYPPEKRPHRGVSWQHVPKFMQSGPITAFSANAAKNACFDRPPYAEQGALSERSERSHTPSKAHLSAGFRMANRTHFLNKLHMPNGTHASDRPPYAEREGVNHLNVV